MLQEKQQPQLQQPSQMPSQKQMFHQGIPNPHHQQQHHNLHQQQQQAQPKQLLLPSFLPQGNIMPRPDSPQPPQLQHRQLQGSISISRLSDKPHSQSGTLPITAIPAGHPQAKANVPPPPAAAAAPTAPTGIVGPKTHTLIPSGAPPYMAMAKTVPPQPNVSGQPSPMPPGALVQKQMPVPLQGRPGEAHMKPEPCPLSIEYTVPGVGRISDNASVMRQQRPPSSVTSAIPTEQQQRISMAQPKPQVLGSKNESSQPPLAQQQQQQQQQAQRNVPRAQNVQQDLRNPSMQIQFNAQQGVPLLQNIQKFLQYPPQSPGVMETSPISNPQQRPVRSGSHPSNTQLQQQPQQQIASGQPTERSPQQIAPTQAQSPAERDPAPMILSPNVRLCDDLAEAGVAPSASVRARQDGGAGQKMFSLSSALRRFPQLVHIDSDEDSSEAEKQATAVPKVEEPKSMPSPQTLATSAETPATSPPAKPPIQTLSTESQQYRHSRLGDALSSLSVAKKDDNNRNDVGDDDDDDDDNGGIGMSHKAHLCQSPSNNSSSKPQSQPCPSVPTPSAACAAGTETGTAPTVSATAEAKPSSRSSKASPAKKNGYSNKKRTLLEKDSPKMHNLIPSTAAPALGTRLKAETERIHSDSTPRRHVRKGQGEKSHHMSSRAAEHSKRVKTPTHIEERAARDPHRSPSLRKETHHTVKNGKKKRVRGHASPAGSCSSLSASLSPSEGAIHNNGDSEDEGDSGHVSQRIEEEKENQSLSSASHSRSPNAHSPQRKKHRSPKGLSLSRRLHGDTHSHSHSLHHHRYGSGLENSESSPREHKTPLRSRHTHRSSRDGDAYVSHSLSAARVFRTNDVYALYRELCRQQEKCQRGRFSRWHDPSGSNALRDSRSTGHVPWRHTSRQPNITPTASPLRRPLGYIPIGGACYKRPSRGLSRSPIVGARHEMVLRCEPFTPQRSFSSDRALSPSHPYEVAETVSESKELGTPSQRSPCREARGAVNKVRQVNHNKVQSCPTRSPHESPNARTALRETPLRHHKNHYRNNNGLPLSRPLSRAHISSSSSPPPQRRCCSSEANTAISTASWLDNVMAASGFLSSPNRVPIPIVDLRRDFRPHIEDPSPITTTTTTTAAAAAVAMTPIASAVDLSAESRGRHVRCGVNYAASASAPSPTRLRGATKQQTPISAKRATSQRQSPTRHSYTEGSPFLPFRAYSTFKVPEPTRPSAWAVAPERKELIAQTPTARRRRILRDTERGEGDIVLVEELRLDEQRRPYVLIKEVPHGKAAREAQRASVERLSKPRSGFCATR